MAAWLRAGYLLLAELLKVLATFLSMSSSELSIEVGWVLKLQMLPKGFLHLQSMQDWLSLI